MAHTKTREATPLPARRHVRQTARQGRVIYLTGSTEEMVTRVLRELTSRSRQTDRSLQ